MVRQSLISSVSKNPCLTIGSVSISKLNSNLVLPCLFVQAAAKQTPQTWFTFAKRNNTDKPILLAQVWQAQCVHADFVLPTHSTTIPENTRFCFQNLWLDQVEKQSERKDKEAPFASHLLAVSAKLKAVRISFESRIRIDRFTGRDISWGVI